MHEISTVSVETALVIKSIPIPSEGRMTRHTFLCATQQNTILSLQHANRPRPRLGLAGLRSRLRLHRQQDRLRNPFILRMR